MKNSICMIRLKPVYILTGSVLLVLLFASQCYNRLDLGQCMFRYVLPRCDYVAYIRASHEILQGKTPYYEKTDYIYTPLLAILMIPFTGFREIPGFAVWTALSVIVYGYGAYRAGSS